MMNPSRYTFRRAVLLSGGPMLRYPTPAEQQFVFKNVASRVSCTNLQCLKKLDVEKIRSIGADGRWGIVEGGSIVREQAAKSLVNNRIAKIPVFIQGMKDEGTFFTQHVKSDSEWVPYTRGSAPFFSEADFKTIDTLYPAKDFANAAKRTGTWFGDFVFDCPAQLLSRTLARQNVPVHNSFYTYENKIPFLGAGLGVFHGSDLPIVFLFQPLLGPGDIEIAKKYHDEIMNFSKGKPVLTTLYRDGNRFDLIKKVIVRDDAKKQKCDFYLKTLGKYTLISKPF
jgi:carboxylesterase type B